ncbi:myosin-14-like [Anopheles bellator]|uniref:myosin-14-like n=1 Tax=Anopheles bellator TaxID=139047 RepID=UPI002648F48F|nr:myosin-14-like [Anopheles bellator]
MSERADDATDEITQPTTEFTEAKTNGARSGQTWHQMLLHPSPSSSQFSYGSDTVPTEAEVRSQQTTPRNARLFGDLDESATNYDSGNFSLSESGFKEKLAIAANSQVGTNEVHQRFVQLNTELYEARTELLAYKYKWNEIRNEIELSWSKKLDKLLDEKNELVQELEALQKDLQRLNGPPVQSDATAGRELYHLRSELEDTKLRLDCKEQATIVLKQTITEQHTENENLSLRLISLKKMLNEARSDVDKAKESRHWFREELHRCQIKNAKLKEFYLTLDHRLHREATEVDTLVTTARTEARNDCETQLRVCQQAKELAEQESMELAKEIKLLKKMDNSRIAELTEYKKQLEKQNLELLTLVEQLRVSLADHQWQLGKLAEKEQKTAETKSNIDSELEIRRSEIERLSAQLARECFTKRQIEVGVEKLKAQVKVLSINFATTYQRLTVQECDLTEFRARNSELQDRCNLLMSEKLRLESELAMCTQQQRTSQQQHNQLLDAFRAIQSKNLELELKLGQCVSGDADDEEPTPLIDAALLRSSEATIGRLRQDISELERKFTQKSSPNASVRPAGRKRHKLCPKHGASCLNSGEKEDSEMRDLCVLLKAIESDNRRRLHRYEVNNRTLLKTVKEHARERKLAEKRTTELEQEHEKCSQLRCEMASLRERCLLLEADLESSQQEATGLRAGKDRLFNLLQNNCLLMADGDVWASLKRAFKELHQLQYEHKKNGRLREQLEGSSTKIADLEASVEHWKLAADTQSNDVDELRSELAVKCLLLEDAHRAVERLEGESKSLQQSASLVAANEASINEQLDELNRLVRIQEIRLETAHERLKLYEESDRVLAASKERFFHDLQSLQDAILQERQEKCELQEEVRELRQNMVNAVENNLQKFHLTQSSNGISGQRSGSIASPDPKSLSTPSPSSLDIDQLQALVEESSRKCCTLQPLNESVSSLRQEMDNLNCVLQSRGFPQHQQPNPRFPQSLMQELNDATNGYYGSR